MIIVNDGSKDKTAQMATEFCATHPRFRVIDSQPNHGKGFVVRRGILEAKGDLILFCDADLATPQEETEKLLFHMDRGSDIAIGSRPLKESSLEVRQPFYREMAGRLFNKIVQALGIRGIDDTQCGFKMFKREVAHDIFKRCEVNGFGFDLECLFIARDLDYTIAEVPIRWRHQEGSKVVLLRDGPRMIMDLIRLRLKGKKKRLAHGSGS